MCTVVVSFAPEDPVPVLLVGVRDEFADRPWRPPGRHWPDLPVTGGLDLQAGGTWLAVNPSVPRMACVLNGWGGTPVPPGRRRSRGDLPLRAASDGPDAVRKLLAERATLERYDAFHLLIAEPSSVAALSWDAATLTSTRVGPGTHLYTNAGHAYPATPAASGAVASPSGAVPAGRGQREPRAAHFGPRFAARRPSGDPRRSLADAWDGWLGLVAGDGLETGDPRALIVRRELPDGRVWGSSSVSLVSLVSDGADRVRYDFRAIGGDAVPDAAVPDAAVPDAAVPDAAVPDAAVPASGDFAWRTVLP